MTLPHHNSSPGHRLGYIEDSTHDEFERLVRGVAAPLNGLIRRYAAGKLLDGPFFLRL